MWNGMAEIEVYSEKVMREREREKSVAEKTED